MNPISWIVCLFQAFPAYRKVTLTFGLIGKATNKKEVLWIWYLGPYLHHFIFFETYEPNKLDCFTISGLVYCNTNLFG